MVVHDLRQEAATPSAGSREPSGPTPRSRWPSPARLCSPPCRGPLEVEAVALGRIRACWQGMTSGPSLLRPQHQLPHRGAPHQPSLRRQGRRHAGRASERRSCWGPLRPAGHLGWRRPGRVRASSASAASLQRQAFLRGPHRLRVSGQAGTQLHRLHRADSPSRGVHHGGQSRRGATGPVASCPTRAPKDAGAPSRVWRSTCSPANSILPTSPCA